MTSHWWKEQCRSAQGLGFMRCFGIGCKVSRDLGRRQFLSGQESRVKNGNAAVWIPFSWSSSIEVRLLYDCTPFVLSLLLEVCWNPLLASCLLLIMHTICLVFFVLLPFLEVELLLTFLFFWHHCRNHHLQAECLQASKKCNSKL